MGFYSRKIFPLLCSWCMKDPKFHEFRREALAPAKGEVLEIGFGSGENLPFYPAGVSRITALEPNEAMAAYSAEKRASFSGRVDLVAAPAEKQPFPDHTFDSVVSTFTLCSVEDPVATLREIRRVLKPEGALLFLEHGKAPSPWLARTQDWLNPIQQIFADGCNVNRDIRALLATAGFEASDMRNFYLPSVPRTHGYMYAGAGRAIGFPSPALAKS